jgi:gamma-glutamyltranspeptidase/glutathione hydrolase
MRANKGLITYQDLKDYKPVIREPLQGTYRGHEILTMPPPSSGGIVLLEMLNMLELTDIAAKGYHSADHLHLLVECMRRAFADRAGLLGDPDFVSMPTKELLSKDYARTRFNGIDPARATPSSAVSAGVPPAPESPDTTHFTVVDSARNVVAVTTTLNDTFGSSATVRGAGFLLNNEMDDFTAKPGVPNLYGLLQSEANAITPGKRPLSSMTPTIVLKNGKPLFALGSPGGPTIINTILQVTSNIIDFGMNAQQAVDSPRFHHQWMPDKIYFDPMGLNPDTRALMERRGHVFSDTPYYDESPYFGDAQIIWIDPESGILHGASDPRRSGAPASLK